MNIFITGATGAIGKALVLKLLENPKLRIFVLAREKSDVSAFPQNENLQILRCDFSSIDKLRDLFQNISVDFFIRLAARVSSWGKKSDFTKDNVSITENILKALSDNLGPESVFVYASTIAVYGFENNYCSEDADLVPMGWHYADSKIIAEEKITSFLKKTKTKPLILRIGDIAGDKTNWVSGVQRESRMGFLLCPRISGTMHFLCVEDVVQLFVKILNSKYIKSGIYNVVGEHRLPFHCFFEQLAQRLGIKTIECRKGVLLFLSYINVFINRILDKKTEFTPETTRYVLGERKISAEKTIKEFNWIPESFCYKDYISTTL